MKIYLLDSDVIISCLRGSRETLDFLDNLLSMGSVLGCCSVNVTEVYAGMREVEQDKTEKLINKLRFFSIDLKVAKLAGDMIRNYKSKGITLSPTDAMIAAVAIYNDLILITNNRKHYPMKELKSISPKDI